VKELRETIAGLDRQEVCELIADDKIHPAVSVAWGQV
jgi:hypothetical protein